MDVERNLLYVRGQLPGPAGQFIYLRDAKSVTEAFRKTWDVPFPALTATTPVPASVAPGGLSVYRNPKDPYRSYMEETDYFEVTWKKSD